MKHTRLIKGPSNMEIKLHKSCSEFMAMLMLGMLEAKTVNLKGAITKIQSHSREKSVYRWAQRFFAKQPRDARRHTLIAFRQNHS